MRIGVVLVVAPSMIALVELDRTAFMAGVGGALLRLIVDAVLVGTVGRELLRRAPRMRGAAALSLVAIALRWAAVVASTCGHASWLVYAAALVPASAAVTFLVASRATARVERSSPSAAVEASRPPPPSGSLVAGSIACAAALPALIRLAHGHGIGIAGQTLLCAAVAAASPTIAYLTAGARPTPRFTENHRVVAGVAVGFAVAVALATSGRLVFDVVAGVARCVSQVREEANVVSANGSIEVARAMGKVHVSTLLVVSSSVVFPLAEERVYRGLLQEVLTRRYGATVGVLAASIAFGLAHLGIYERAIYQTVLLGIGFGIAYLEGGIVAAFLVHAAWNLLQFTASFAP